MPSPSASSPIELPIVLPIEREVGRIRELSRGGRHSEALAAAEVLAARAPQNRDSLSLIAANQRCLSRIPEALATLQRLEQQHPRFSLLYSVSRRLALHPSAWRVHSRLIRGALRQRGIS